MSDDGGTIRDDSGRRGWNLFAQEKRVLHSNLDPESCRSRLAAETGSLWNPLSGWSHVVRGRVNERGFWIVRTIHYRNSFQTVARGRWSADGNGTRIELKLGPDVTVRIFMAATIAMVAAIAAVWWLEIGKSTTMPPGAEGIPRVFPLLIVMFSLLAMAFGRWLARNDAAFLMRFLTRTLECSPDAEPIE
ncbi:MAG TPA: hypothetical protein VL123_08050 [Candidatus Udaeobacter sp.]|jgi:hypothetical protein|nr:hypothetical protein [Candidatus Udaeobacter sp.]